MSDCKTGAEHIKSLKDGRTVYLDGKLVGDVTEHPAFRNAVHSAAALYDYQAQPENLEFMTFRPNGSNRRVNRAWQMPRSYEEMVQRRKALQAWAAQSCGYFGRSPDHLASSLVGQRMGIEVFRKHSPERAKAFADYFDFATKNDLFLTYVIINPQAERSKGWGEQDEDLVARIVDEDASGVTIRGAKMLGTSSIMANEVFVANLQPLKAGEEALAFSCALPMNAKGLRVLSRKSYEQHAVSLYDNPLSARFDENDALDVFRRRESALGAAVRLSRSRHVPRAISRHAGARLSELSGADPAVGEDRFPRRARAPRHRGDRHHQHPVRRRATRHAGGGGRHGQRDAVGHGGLGLSGRRMVCAEQAFHVFGAGADPGPLSAGDTHHPRVRRRRADHAALLGARFRQSGNDGDHQQDTAFGDDGAGAER